jgi:signal transduction histidine kinase
VVAGTTETSLTRLAAIGRRHPLLSDVAPVAVIILLGIGALHEGPHGGPPSGIFTIALALPLLWRRRAPVAVFALLSAIALVQWALGVLAFGDSALLVALYTVASTQTPQRTLAAAAVLEVGILMATMRWAGASAVIRSFVSLSGLAAAAGVLGTSVRHRRALLASLEERAARLERERDQQGRLSAAAERARIAREMHDIVAHNLSVMIALADGAGYALHDAPDRAEAAMANVSRTGRQALTEMRGLLGVLRDEGGPQALAPQPGLAEIEALVGQLRAAGVTVGYEVGGVATTAPPPGLQLAAYRIVQEALTNTLKHAGPGAQAHVTLRHAGDALELEITDTGTGGPAPAGAAQGGGLRGMRERAALYGGVARAGPVAGGGWQVRAQLRLPAAVEVTA